MTEAQINEYLSKAMNICWHDWQLVPENDRQSQHQWCPKCDKRWTLLAFESVKEYRTDFFTWKGFGTLWEWTERQSWLVDFLKSEYAGPTKNYYRMNTHLIGPDKLANAIYKFLKERENA